MNNPNPTEPVATHIAALLAWARALSEAGPAADPTERAAYQAAKTALLAHLAHRHPNTNQPSTKDTL